MTLTSFIDVKADPPKPDETKVDLLNGSNNESVDGTNDQQPPVSAIHAVEYVELYNYRVARRRRICRAVAWLLALFLLVDIVFVLYLGLRMRRHASAGDDSEGGSTATVTCRLRFRRPGRPDGGEDRAEQVTARGSRVLMQPMWAADGRPTVLHDSRRGFTLLRAPSAGLCFVKHASWRRDGWTAGVAKWAKHSHEVSPEQTRYVRLVAVHPAISLERLMTYGNLAWRMCRHYSTFRVELVPGRPVVNCPMYKCVPCPSGIYLRDSRGCQTCQCGSHESLKRRLMNDALGRNRRSVGGGGGASDQRKVLQLDEGVLPDDQGRSVHTIDVIEF